MNKTLKDAQVAGVESKSAANPTAGFIDKKAVAELLGFSRRHVDNLLAQGCPHMRFGKRRTRFDAAEVLEWCKEKFGTRRIGKARTEKEAT